MSQSFQAPGNTLTLTAPYARATSGLGALVGSIFGVSCDTVASGAEGQFETSGVHYLAKTSAQAWAVGDKIYWDDTLKVCTTDGSLGPLIGSATVIAANPTASGYVKLNGRSSARAGSIPTSTVAAAGTTAANAGALPAAGFVLVSAADATKGVVLPAAVAGLQLVIKNSAAAVLKVWPATGDAVNAGAVDAVFSCPASTSFTITAYDATTWYTTPLLPS